ncbi:hypothetical protein Tco_0933447 [Tanacetum coccineum]
MSSAEAEYVTAAGWCAQVLWMKSQLADYDILYDKVPIFCDNTSVIAISNNPVLHSITKHIDIRSSAIIAAHTHYLLSTICDFQRGDGLDYLVFRAYDLI